MSTSVFGCCLWFALLQVLQGQAFLLKNVYTAPGDVALHIDPTTDGVKVELYQDGFKKLEGIIGVGVNFIDSKDQDKYTLYIATVNNGFRIEWVSNDTSRSITDCYLLNAGSLNWFGGPQIYQQDWPIEKLQLSGGDPYVTRKDGNFATPERFWLNSQGGYIFVDDRVPLYIDQNMKRPDQVCFIANNTGPYIGRSRVFHSYLLIALQDPKAAFIHAKKNYLGKPTKIPNMDLIRDPIWTTWAKYKKHITDSMVRDFAYQILDHGFKGQIEIDEQWETCFGSRVFLPNEFGNISQVVKDLKSHNLRVTLWAAPFVNPDCADVVKEGEDKGYFVKNIKGNMDTIWWENSEAKARQIDFTNPEAAEWYSGKLRNVMKNTGIDGFKFDAGETNYVAQPAVYKNEDPELVPNIFSQKYIHTVAQFGEYIEARTAFRTQNYSFLLRMIDKDSLWTIVNGLPSLITTLLQLNINGYSFVLPDMIGGNGYRAQPDLELLIRWTQANTFMPSMQFSYLPWDFPNNDQLNGTEIIRSFISLHEKYSDEIKKALQASISENIPTNPPIWWIDPTDKTALQNNNEYLLGEKILVAPVMEKGATSRQVYLPRGKWQDGNNKTKMYEGPIGLTYEAPLAVLPYFIRQ